MFSEPRDEEVIERLFDRLNVDTRLRRPTCLSLEDFVSRAPSPPSTDPALPVPLVDTSSTASTLELRCEGLVATVRCARGTLQVRELVIKAVRKAKRVRVGAVAVEGRVKEIDMIVSQAERGVQVCWRALWELVKVEEVVEDNRLFVD